MYELRDDISRATSCLRGEIHDRNLVFNALMGMCHAKRIVLQENDAIPSTSEGFGKRMAALVKEKEEDKLIAHLVEDVFSSPMYLGKTEDVVIRQAYEFLPDDDATLRLAITYTAFEYEICANADRGTHATPGSIIELVAQVLRVSEGGRVADFGTANGAFLSEISSMGDYDLLYGCEVNSQAAAVAKIRANAIGPVAVVEQADMFHVEGKFDKCFSNYPFGMKNRGFREEALFSLREQGFADIPKFASSDWLFNLELIARLEDGGRAVGIMTRGSAFNGADKTIRGYFVENGWVEAVVALPDRVFSPATNVPTAMIILSRGNEDVRLVDASEICQIGHRAASFSYGDIDTIVRLLDSDEEGVSRTVTRDELARAEYSLNPSRYLEDEIEVHGGVPLEKISRRITRGYGWGRRQLDELSTNRKTKCHYLMLQNIVNGEIEEDLPCLRGIDESQKRYCVDDGDLVLSTVGPNFRVAVARVPKGERVLATSNLYIIQLDTEVVDPRYVKIYLESEQGLAQMCAASTGTVQTRIPVRALSEIKIPMIPLEEQRKIAEEYEAIRGEIALHELAIKRARQKMTRILDEA